MAKNESKPQQYVVAHGGVGNFYRGQTVTACHFHETADIDRLVRIGALVPAESYEAGQLVGSIKPEELAPDGTPLLQSVPVPPEVQTGNPATSVQQAVTAQQQAGNTGATVNTTQPA